ncbi:MAG: ATP-binding cassette domain-containing protein [Gaiella sp.]
MSGGGSTATASGVAIRALRKYYGDTRALDGLDLEARPGEVLGIAGPNGAGKSTLIKILAGEERADDGEVSVDGTPWTPSLAASLVAVVHQEAQLFPNLTVAENLLVGREGTRFLRPRVRRAERELMATLGIAELAGRPLEAVALASQQRTEIARALAREARVFLFDEPNSALTDDESDELFREMAALAEAGRIVLFVTHRLVDLVAHSSRVVVIRDGRIAAEFGRETLTEEAIAQQLVLGGAEREAVAHAAAVRQSKPGRHFAVTGWTHRKGSFSDIQLAVEQGEIVALMGVEGSGGRELLRSFAALERVTGELELAGRRGRRALITDTAYVSASRQLSLYSNFTVGENLITRLGSPEIAGTAWVLRRQRMRQLARDSLQRFLVKARSISQSIRSLSGGNQQKVAIAQALAKRPLLLLLEEPTRGVDIQSKREIYRLLHEFATGGNAVIMYCTEVPEVFEAADRVHVVADGRLSAALPIEPYEHVEALATDIARLERHAQDADG